jgi:glycosyltransferase involved in cell wall biosynthesis
MRVHLLSNLFPPDVLGGYELLASDVAIRLRARGHEVTVVTSGTGDEEPGIARVMSLSRPFADPASSDRLRHLAAAIRNRAVLGRLIRQRGLPDAVLVMSLRRLGLEPLRVYAELGAPSVVTVNDDWPVSYVRGRGGRPLSRALLDRGPLARHTWRGIHVERAVYLSETIRSVVRASGAPMPVGVVRAQGVDLKHFHPRPFRPIGDAPKLLFVGRIHPTKAPDVAIDALKTLRARGVDAHLTIAGGAADPVFEAELRARAAPVASHVRWLGQVDRSRLRDVYAAADAFVYPLRWAEEAQGLTYMEAMAVGVPVVAFPCGGARELLDDHDATARSAECTGDAFADALMALTGDVSRQRAIVARGTSMVNEHASLDRYVDALENELFEAAKRRPGEPNSQGAAA